MSLSTPYQELSTHDVDNEMPLEHAVIFHSVDDKTKWSLIPNLDHFFQHIYKFHQQQGFKNIILKNLVDLLVPIICFALVIGLVGFLRDDDPTVVYHGSSVIILILQYIPSTMFWFPVFICITFPSIAYITFWIYIFIKRIRKYLEIQRFYIEVLRVQPDQLEDLTWHDVQSKLLAVQSEFQVSINKKVLTEIDIYHRILRFKNYFVALTNKNLLPMKYQVPLLGQVAFFPNLLRLNLQYLFFEGPLAMFTESWKLDDIFKKSSHRKQAEKILWRRFILFTFINAILMVPIFLVHIFFWGLNYTEQVKRDPNVLSLRVWSPYAQQQLRHFNENDHELNARLSRAHKPARLYISNFSNHTVSILCKFGSYLFAALALLTFLTILYEERIDMPHNLALLALFSLLFKGCQSMIPDEFIVRRPEQLMEIIISNIHYAPTNWVNASHTRKVREEFSMLFPYRVVNIISELISPLLIPFILFSMRKRSLDIVDFFRHNTVHVDGVGDVCSFATMDIRKHGNPAWTAGVPTLATQTEQTQLGKAELSLMHFSLTNPTWVPPEPAQQFLRTVQTNATREIESNPQRNQLYQSVVSMSSLDGMYSDLVTPKKAFMQINTNQEKYCLRKPYQEGPDYPSDAGVLGSMHEKNSLNYSDAIDPWFTPKNMGVSMLYLHQMHSDSLNNSHPSQRIIAEPSGLEDHSEGAYIAHPHQLLVPESLVEWNESTSSSDLLRFHSENLTTSNRQRGDSVSIPMNL